MNWLNGGATLEKIERVDGENAYVVKISDNKRIYYSVDTGLKVKEVNVQEVQGQSIESTLLYGDYNEVGGIQFPFTLTQSQGPQSIDFKMTDIKVNEGVTDADFD